ncbi:MAG TPA: ABC transporter ATP-binding protein [Dongiaceae bacterium]|nr:ABC transporter ATP-binding protein [Dongiaceae bacterium]
MASVALRSVRKSFGPVDVIRGIDLDVADGEFVAIVGPSGCGKSTLLRMIAGLTDLTAGDVSIDGVSMLDVPASKRGIAIVFQSYALYPHMTAGRNIGFALETAGIAKAAIREKVTRIAAMLKIDHLLDRRPRELSGGQRQRVAIGRALVREPKVFLFDEPLSNLDADLRTEMRVEIARLHDELKATMIYVTHDQVEATTLADRIVILKDGHVEQIGTPKELYCRPANRFVAGFIGSPRMNFASVGSGGLALPIGSEPVAAIGVRPEAVVVQPRPGDLSARGRLVRVEDLGHEQLLYVALESGAANALPWTVRLAAGQPVPPPNEPVALGWSPAAMHRFDAEGRRIGGAAS